MSINISVHLRKITVSNTSLVDNLLLKVNFDFATILSNARALPHLLINCLLCIY